MGLSGTRNQMAVISFPTHQQTTIPTVLSLLLLRLLTCSARGAVPFSSIIKVHGQKLTKSSHLSSAHVIDVARIFTFASSAKRQPHFSLAVLPLRAERHVARHGLARLRVGRDDARPELTGAALLRVVRYLLAHSRHVANHFRHKVPSGDTERVRAPSCALRDVLEASNHRLHLCTRHRRRWWSCSHNWHRSWGYWEYNGLLQRGRRLGHRRMHTARDRLRVVDVPDRGRTRGLRTTRSLGCMLVVMVVVVVMMMMSRSCGMRGWRDLDS